MSAKHRWTVAVVAAALIVVPVLASAQMVTLPPDGKNQKASVSQWIGLVEVNVTYNAPKVTAPDGTDRTGKIWGQLVPYGMANLGFGTCGDQCPWRAGANENTVFRVSHDVKIEGQPLPAGSYGLHMIPGPDEWTIIFSKNSTSWGSFFYNAGRGRPARQGQAEEVRVQPLADLRVHRAAARPGHGGAEVGVPGGAVDDHGRQRHRPLRREPARELRNAPGFNWEGWEEAARFCLDQKTNLKEALGWAQNAVSLPYIGQENFTTLRTLADLQAANGMAAEADATMQKALEHPTARPIDLHQYGRQLLAAGEKEKALKVFELNAKKHPNAWPVNVGLARGYAAVGRTKDALKYAKLAVQQAPDELNKKNLQKMVEDLEAGRPVK